MGVAHLAGVSAGLFTMEGLQQSRSRRHERSRRRMRAEARASERQRMGARRRARAWPSDPTGTQSAQLTPEAKTGGNAHDDRRNRRRRRRQRQRSSTSCAAQPDRLSASILLCVFLSLSTDTFLSVRNFLNVMDQITVLGVMAVGMTLVILIGGIDLSVGSVLALSGMVMGYLGNISALAVRHRDRRRADRFRVMRRRVRA